MRLSARPILWPDGSSHRIDRRRPRGSSRVCADSVRRGCSGAQRFGEVPVVYGRDGDAIAAVLPAV
jgi:hypothetical protein